MAKPKKARGGSDVFVVHVRGDKNVQLEPSEHRIMFPGGWVGVSRTTDNAYWVHVGVHRHEFDGTSPDSDRPALPARIRKARLDMTNRNAGQEDVGDFNSPNLYHLAMLIEPAGTFVEDA